MVSAPRHQRRQEMEVDERKKGERKPLRLANVLLPLLLLLLLLLFLFLFLLLLLPPAQERKEKVQEKNLDFLALLQS